MSSVLPPELYLAILDNLVVPPLDYEDHQITQNTFTQTCLASRALRSAAQPLLFRHIWIRHENEAEKIREAARSTALGSQTTIYIITVDAGSSYETVGNAVNVARALPNITDLWLGYNSRFEERMEICLKPLDTHRNLRHLHLQDVKFDASPPCTFPQLELLVMYDCEMSALVARAWLQPVHLPRVVVLDLIRIRRSSRRRQYLRLARTISPEFLLQLDYLRTDVNGVDPLSEWASGVAPPVLIVDPEVGKGDLPRHTAFSRASLFDPFARALATPSLDPLPFLGRLGEELWQGSTDPPPVVVLGRSIAEQCEVMPGLEHEIRASTTWWEDLGIRVFWFDDTCGCDMRAAQGSGFWRYGRELRLAREAAA